MRLCTTEKDDPDFIRLIERVINKLLDDLKPKEIYLVEIDRWFDHKWLGFSGIGVVEYPTLNLPGGSWSESALDEFSQDQITFPPFIPNRVLQQRYYSRSDEGIYLEKAASSVIHKYQRSSENLHRRICDFSDSAIFAWSSSDTAHNDRGSLMVYSIQETSVKTWFASFTKRKEWKLALVKGIDRNQLSEVLRGGTP
jgi:hypothetical protein